MCACHQHCFFRRVCTLNAILVKGNMHNARLFLVLRARLTVGRFAPYASTPTVGGSLVTIRCRSCASLSSSTVFGAMDFVWCLVGPVAVAVSFTSLRLISIK